jgi:hypothetical protein
MKLVPGELEWGQPEAFRRRYQLTKNGQVVGTLGFEKLGGSLATGQCGPNSWTMKRTGFLSPRVLVREAGSDQDFAIFTPTGTGGGSLALASGRLYQLRAKNFWATEWAFDAEDGTPAMVLSGSPGLFKQGAHATVTDFGGSLPEAPMLVLLIWYLRILMNEDASTATIIAATS